MRPIPSSVLAIGASILVVPLLAAALSAPGLLPSVSLAIATLLMFAFVAARRGEIAASFDVPRVAPLGLALLIIGTLLAAVRLWGVAIFMMDPSRAELSAIWNDPFYIGHNCFTAWYQGALFAVQRVPNVYLNEMYSGTIGRFRMDDLLYPSPFLLLPRAMLAFTHSFTVLRCAWFAAEGGLFLAATTIVAKWVGGRDGGRVLLLTPFLWLSTPVLLTMQIGNFQPAALALTMLALVAFDRRRSVTGGALLGFALFKLFPGIVLVPMAVQRRWRDLTWTAVFGALYTAASIAWMGTAPFVQFFKYQLPRITSGSAWEWLESWREVPVLAKVVAINQSIPGLALKAEELGLTKSGHAGVHLLSIVYTLVVVVLAVLAGIRLREANRLTQAQIWIALLSLAALRSPFVPDTYALIPALWLWTLTMPRLWERRSALVAGALLWVPLALSLPFEGPFAPVGMPRIVLGLIVQFIAVSFAGVPFLRPVSRPAFDLIQETA